MAAGPNAQCPQFQLVPFIKCYATVCQAERLIVYAQVTSHTSISMFSVSAHTQCMHSTSLRQAGVHDTFLQAVPVGPVTHGFTVLPC